MVHEQAGAIRYQRRSIAVGRGQSLGAPRMAGPSCRDTTGKHDGNSMNMKRMRGRNQRSGGGGGGGSSGSGGGGGMRHHVAGGTPLNRNHVFDSNGPDIRVRGTAQQLFEKYLQLGRAATSGGDRKRCRSGRSRRMSMTRISGSCASPCRAGRWTWP